MQNADIIIVGAGAAGLMAAKKLSAAGKKVLIVEARDRIGGRIYTLDAKEWGYEAEGGGEFVHGDAPVTTALIEEAGLHFEKGSERSWWSVRDGPVQKVEWDPMKSQYESILIEALQSLKEDMPVRVFLDTQFGDEKYAQLRDQIIRRVESFDAADPARASSFMLRDEMTTNSISRQRDFKEGYGALVRFLVDRCETSRVEIVLQKEVIAVEIEDDSIRITCKHGETYGAKQIVVSVPPPVIRTISFTPPIPEKVHAAELIGFGGVIKVLLRFKTKWWSAKEEKFDNLFFMFSRESIPTWWTQYPQPYLTLTGWLPGPSAAKLAHHTEAELVELALQSLSNIFEIPIDDLKQELLASKAVNWIADPYARGAYSYETPESKDARAELLKSVDGKIFFAGEAIGETEIGGTVEAAFASGVQVAERILHSR